MDLQTFRTMLRPKPLSRAYLFGLLQPLDVVLGSFMLITLFLAVFVTPPMDDPLDRAMVERFRPVDFTMRVVCERIITFTLVFFIRVFEHNWYSSHASQEDPWLLKLVSSLASTYFALLNFRLYSALSPLIVTLHGARSFDLPLLRIEEWLLDSNPALQLHIWFPSRILGEFLHIFYMALHPMIVSYSIAFTMHALYPLSAALPRLHRVKLAAPHDAARFSPAMLALTSSSMCFLTCWLISIAMTVHGPVVMYERPPAEAFGYTLAASTRALNNGRSATGTAFPSVHCSAATVMTICLYRFFPQNAARPIFLAFYSFLTPGLVFATMYCGYHYVLDAAAGVTIGVLCGLFGDRITAAFVTPPIIRRYYKEHSSSNVLTTAFDRIDSSESLLDSPEA